MSYYNMPPGAPVYPNPQGYNMSPNTYHGSSSGGFSPYLQGPLQPDHIVPAAYQNQSPQTVPNSPYYQASPQMSPHRHSNDSGRLADFCPPGYIPALLYDVNMPLGSLIFQTESYDSLSQQLVQQRRVYTDPHFPTSHPTHYTLPPHCVSPTGSNNLIWKRIIEVYPEGKFMPPEGPQSYDIIQGLLGNCWFIGALASFSASRSHVERVIPQPWPLTLLQTHPVHYECTLFRFRFWKWGKWIEVIVDDRLPFLADSTGQLLHPPQLAFARSNRPKYFWVSLLEKAYAKLHGSYAALDAGTAADAMIDFTGGVAEVMDMRPIVRSLQTSSGEKAVKELWKKLKEAAEHQFFINCTNKCNNQASIADHSQLSVGGLLLTHVYSVCQVHTIRPQMNRLMKVFSKKEYHILVLRNPWGMQEWKGAWAVGSVEWREISEEQRQELQHSLTDKGKFLICLDDFIVNFTHVSICRTMNVTVKSRYGCLKEFHFYGGWRCPHRAGGCVDNPTWHHNPQYQLIVNKKSQIIISLQQRESRLFGFQNQTEFTSELSIGFHVFKVEQNRTFRLHQRTGEIPGNKSFINTRQVAQSYDVTEGNYIIVPVTFASGLEGDFLIRIWSFESAISRELVDEIPRDLAPYSGRGLIVCVWICQASLEKIKGFHMDNKLFVRCTQREISYTTRTISSLTAQFDEGFLFYFGPNLRRETFQLEVIHPSKLKKEKLIGTCQFSLDKILQKPSGSRLKTRSMLSKSSGSDDIVGSLEYIISYYSDPYSA